jgi:hypothetical protein
VKNLVVSHTETIHSIPDRFTQIIKDKKISCDTAMLKSVEERGLCRGIQ